MRRVMMAAALMAAASCAQKPAEPAAADRPAPPSASASVFPHRRGLRRRQRRADLLRGARQGRAAADRPRRAGRVARLLPAVPAAARAHEPRRSSSTSAARGSRRSSKTRRATPSRTWSRTSRPCAKHLGLGKINLLGHSYGGVLAQAYAFKYQANLCAPDSRQHLPQHQGAERGLRPDEGAHDAGAARRGSTRWRRRGSSATGRPYEQGRYTADYMVAAWGEGYFPYVYQKHPGSEVRPGQPRRHVMGSLSRDVGLARRVRHRRQLTSVEYADRLATIKVPTLITVGDHDEVSPSICARRCTRRSRARSS